MKVDRARQLRRDSTPEERVLWERLRANRLGDLHFRRQQIVDGFIVDFYCHAAGLVIELDGGIHDEQRDYDVGRDEVLVGRGLRVLRIRNEEIRDDLEGALTRILAIAAKT